MPPWLMDRWWDIGKTTCFYSTTALWSLRTAGAQNVPRTGPVLALANHQSFLDPVLVGLAIPRYVRFVHRQSLKKNRLLAWWMASLRAIPIDHKGFSREGLQATLDSLGGRQLRRHVPGRRANPRRQRRAVQAWHLAVAKRLKAPILPVGVAGAYAAFSRHMKIPRLSPLFMPPNDATIAVSVGKPIDPAKYAKVSREEMLEDLRRAVIVEKEAAETLRR